MTQQLLGIPREGHSLQLGGEDPPLESTLSDSRLESELFPQARSVG